MVPEKILGIDPGSRHLGFAVVSKSGTSLCVHTHGTLHFSEKKDIFERLPEIYQGIRKIILEFSPQTLAIEKVFFAKNALSALKLGQARGVVLLAAAEAGLGVREYSPNEVKSAVVGHGHATKEQIGKMASLLTGIREFESSDASDAVAIAICHLQAYGKLATLRARFT